MNEPIKYTISKEDCQSINISDWVNQPMNIVCNGFSIKDTILDALNELDTDDMEYIAEHITDALATKLRLKQG